MTPLYISVCLLGFRVIAKKEKGPALALCSLSSGLSLVCMVTLPTLQLLPFPSLCSGMFGAFCRAPYILQSVKYLIQKPVSLSCVLLYCLSY